VTARRYLQVTVVEDDERDRVVLVEFGGLAATRWYVDRKHLADPAGYMRKRAKRRRELASVLSDPKVKRVYTLLAEELELMAEQMDGAS
jgi:hypothetical protein